MFYTVCIENYGCLRHSHRLTCGVQTSAVIHICMKAKLGIVQMKYLHFYLSNFISDLNLNAISIIQWADTGYFLFKILHMIHLNHPHTFLLLKKWVFEYSYRSLNPFPHCSVDVNVFGLQFSTNMEK